MIPYVIEQSGGVERQYDIYSRLLKDRIIFIGEEIDDHVANIEKMTDCKVFLDLHVKVRKDWKNRQVFLDEFGYKKKED